MPSISGAAMSWPRTINVLPRPVPHPVESEVTQYRSSGVKVTSIGQD